MPIYMDIHEVPGAAAVDLAEAHRKDMLIQDEFRCKCMTYWLDERRGNAFCLIEAPDQTALIEMHRKSHGFIPHKIIEVASEVIESFLGRIHDPREAEVSGDGMRVFSESAFRILLVTEMTEPVLLRHRMGLREATELLKRLNNIIRNEIAIYEGSEVEHTGNGFIVSFSSAARAMTCASEIQDRLPGPDKKMVDFKLALNAGEPVAKSDKVFGDTIQLARYLCTVVRSNNHIIISSVVKDLLKTHDIKKSQAPVISLSPQDEILLEALFNKLEENWQNPDFTVTEFCRAMSMSKSQLYRKTTAFWELSPNLILKEYRLNKALELLNGQSVNISQTTFDSGFTSPSYFTKCFKNKFGLLPANYLNSVH
jgi:AraC-like DNA-binding protein